MLLTSANMLDHMSMPQHGDRIRKAVMKTVRAGKTRTFDMGGYSTTQQFSANVAQNLGHIY